MYCHTICARKDAGKDAAAGVVENMENSAVKIVSNVKGGDR